MSEHTKKSKLDETMEKLESGVKEIFDTDNYKQYLRTVSVFHSYSINNNILIWMQKPDATHVAGYKTWQKLNRQVQKGEVGINIVAPCTYKKMKEVEVKDDDGNCIRDNKGTPVTEKKEVELQGYRVISVFDYSQTAGEPLPQLVKELTDVVNDYDDYLDAIRDISPVPIRFDEIQGGAKGYYSPRTEEIVVKRGMSEEMTIKTALHEVAHAKLHHGSKEDECDRRTAEVQAESVAYCCASALGLDASEYSFGYVAGWSSGKDIKELRSSLDVIRKTADEMITGIETKMQQVLDKRVRMAEISVELPKQSRHMAM